MSVGIRWEKCCIYLWQEIEKSDFIVASFPLALGDFAWWNAQPCQINVPQERRLCLAVRNSSRRKWAIGRAIKNRLGTANYFSCAASRLSGLLEAFVGVISCFRSIVQNNFQFEGANFSVHRHWGSNWSEWHCSRFRRSSRCSPAAY